MRLAWPLFAFLCLSFHAPAFAAESSPPKIDGISGWGILGWDGGIGIGGRYIFPLLQRGFLDPIGGVEDRLVMEVGADALSTEASLVFHTYRETELRPTVGTLWYLQLDSRWSVYPKLDLGYSIGWVSGWDDRWGAGPTGKNRFTFDLAGGAMYKLGAARLRAELGSMGVKLGAGFVL